MALIREDVAAQIKQEFAALDKPVRLVVFHQALVDPESEQVKRLIEELAALDSRLSAESVNFVIDKERAEALKVARTPAVAVLGQDTDHGVRFYGLPTGYEFGTLIDAILDVSREETGLQPATLTALAALTSPVHIQVFSTPT
jgi:alkyl hydroperoxide reductase subunit AhpF